MRGWLGRLALTLCVTLVTLPVQAENYAFLVAVQDYDVKDLKKLNYTRSDITEFGKLLEQAGFKARNVITLTDKPEQARYLAEAERIRKQFDLLLSSVESGDTLIVAFSGHGVQFEGEEKNYYCPLDADLEDAKRTKLIGISEIYDKLKQCPAEKKLLLVDACRNDPLSPVKKSRATVNLKSVTRPQTEAVPKGVVALFSCSAGQESYEWPDLKHGVFFHHVLKGWEGAADNGDNDLTLDELVAYSRKETQDFARTTLDARQSPQLKSDFEGTWVLRKLETPIEPELVSSIGMKLRLIPKGEFLMGSPKSEVGRHSSETQHRVKITKNFYLGKYEVTQAEFKKVMGRNLSWLAPDGEYKERVRGLDTDRFPAEMVSWYDAVEFCNILSKQEGLATYYRLTINERGSNHSIQKADCVVLGGNGYRLPTEAEWEYACRGGTKTKYHFGDDPKDLGDYQPVELRPVFHPRNLLPA